MVLIGLCTLFGACSVDDSTADEPRADDLCAQAAEHLQGCYGEPIALPDDCATEDAERLLEQSCASLLDPGKADLFNNWLCGTGLLRHCPAPVCDPGPEVQAELQQVHSCADYIDLPGCASCDYYRCREQSRANPCGDDGYFIGFGHNYCDRFSELTVPNLSPAGQQWIADVRPCLQLALEDIDDDMECGALRDFAYQTHPGCYVETGFCELPLGDLWAVLNTVELRDLGIRQPLVTGVSCIKELFDPRTLELSDDGLQRLRAAGVLATNEDPRRRPVALEPGV